MKNNLNVIIVYFSLKPSFHKQFHQFKFKNKTKPFHQLEGRSASPIAFYWTTSELAALFSIQTCIAHVIKVTDHVSELYSLPDKNADLYLPICLCRQDSCTEQSIRITRLMQGSNLVSSLSPMI